MRHMLIGVVALVFVLPFSASAQSFNTMGATSDSFTISSSPQYPVPYGQAVLSFLSSSLDLANATMTVFANGSQVYAGNVQSFPVTLGKPGSVTTIDVNVSSAGAQYSQSLTIQPQDVSLIAEPIASTPVLYPGKPSVPINGSTRIVAIANLVGSGGAIDPATLSYSWVVDGTRIANSSGIGKDALVVASPLQYRIRSVSVVVQDQAGTLVGGASLTLSASEPSVRLYVNDPLLGIRYDRALVGTYTIPGSEASLFAAPFSLPLSAGAPVLQWFLDGSSAQSGSLITLRPSGSGQGSASLSLTASAGAAEVTANLSLSFGAAPSSNFFGL